MGRSFSSLKDEISATWDEETRHLYQATTAYFDAQVRAQQNLGAQIAQLRALEGVTQTQLAEVSGVSQPEISRIEQGGGNPTRDTLVKLATALRAHLVLLPDDSALAH